MSGNLETERLKALRHLAGLIDDALKRGQRADDRLPENEWPVWSNLAFSKYAGVAEASIRSWTNRENPVRPANIVVLLNAFFGQKPKFAKARAAMDKAWRQAGGVDLDEPRPPLPVAIQAESFVEIADLVALSVSQPIPTNGHEMMVRYSLIISPDTDCTVGDRTVDIGLVKPLLVFDSNHWQPVQDSFFFYKENDNVKRIGLEGAVEICGPRDKLGRIDGAPLIDEPSIAIEPKDPAGADGMAFEVRAARGGFLVTAPGGTIQTDAQAAVLDAIFASGLPKDRKGRMIVKRVTVPMGPEKRGTWL